VRDRENVKQLSNNDVDDGKRETLEDEVTNLIINARADLRTVQQQLDDALNLVTEPLA
jgi:hypothetical protein